MDDKNSFFGSTYPRRDFLIRAAGTAAGIAAAPLVANKAFAVGDSSVVKSKVCLVLSSEPLSPDGDVSEKIGAMLDAGIKYISGKDDPLAYWKENFSAKDRVAVKLSAVIDKQLNFGPQITASVADRLVKAGVAADEIVFWDRDTKHLKKAGYKTNVKDKGIKYYGTNEVGYAETSETAGEVTATFSNILNNSTALINIPIVKTHSLAGISVALKNHYGSFSKPHEYHANACDPFIADLNLCPAINNRHRLVVADAMRVLYGGGPEFNREYTEEFNGLIISTDPVAVDSVSYMIIRKLRKKSGKSPLPYLPKPIHIETAAKKGLGVSNPDLIEMKTITV